MGTTILIQLIKSITSQVSKEISMVKIHCKSYTVPLVENSDGIKYKSNLFCQNRRFISSCWLFLVAKKKKKKKKEKREKDCEKKKQKKLQTVVSAIPNCPIKLAYALIMHHMRTG